MRYRLIELIEEADHKCGYQNKADYLIANGVIVPPCKVGETVYLLKFNTVIMCKVETIYCGVGIYLRLKPCYQPYVGNRSIYYKVAASRFGKTVFSSADEAERALKEREG